VPAEDFTIGVEEEYQLVDPTSRRLVAQVDRVLPVAEQHAPDEVSHELQETMIEIGTPVCRTLEEVRAELIRLRTTVGAAAASRGVRIVAAGSHPTSPTDEEHITDQPGYREIAGRYAHLATEQKVFGCHVHVGVADRDLGIAAMNMMRPWLPVLLALSASSPFWGGIDTGYASYRSVVFGRWPTAGPAEAFASRAEYDRVVDDLLATESIDDRARLYWDVRPSARYETVEVRIADVCTWLDDAVLIAGLCGALVRTGVAMAGRGDAAPFARSELVRAARWRAGRFGLVEDLIDVTAARAAPAAVVVERLLDLLAPALRDWGELDTVTDLATVVMRRGTSADRQRHVLDTSGSMDDVVDWLVDTTGPDPSG